MRILKKYGETVRWRKRKNLKNVILKKTCNISAWPRPKCSFRLEPGRNVHFGFEKGPGVARLTFRLGPGRNVDFGPAQADAAIFSKFFQNVYYFSNLIKKIQY